MSFEEKTPLQIFSSFLQTVTLASTYQLVLLRSILFLTGYQNPKPDIEWGKDWITEKGDVLEVKLDFFAVPFTKYYWDMFYNFKLKQSLAPNRYFNRSRKEWTLRQEDDLNIHKYFKNPYLREHNLKEKPPIHLKEFSGKKYDPMRQKIIEKSFREPLQAKGLKKFYKKRKGGVTEPLKFNIEMINFMSKYNVLLEYALNYKLTRYLEGINEKRSLIAEIILIEIQRKNLKLKEKEIYDKEYKESNCFYCNKNPAKPRDHVIPFNFRPSQELHNSVPSCVNCNATKHDNLPTTKIFELVLKRNRDFGSKGYFENYSEEDYKKLYKQCKETYHSGEYFSVKREE